MDNENSGWGSKNQIPHPIFPSKRQHRWTNGVQKYKCRSFSLILLQTPDHKTHVTVIFSIIDGKKENNPGAHVTGGGGLDKKRDESTRWEGDFAIRHPLPKQNYIYQQFRFVLLVSCVFRSRTLTYCQITVAQKWALLSPTLCLTMAWGKCKIWTCDTQAGDSCIREYKARAHVQCPVEESRRGIEVFDKSRFNSCCSQRDKATTYARETHHHYDTTYSPLSRLPSSFPSKIFYRNRTRGNNIPIQSRARLICKRTLLLSLPYTFRATTATWDGEVFRTSKSSNPSSSRAAFMSKFIYSGMYGSVCKTKDNGVWGAQYPV